MGRPHFCCCLPIRLGALLITFGSFFWAGLAAGALWYIMIAGGDLIEDKKLKIALGVVAGGYTLTTIFSLVGLWGVLRQKFSLMRTYVSIFTYYLGATYVYSIAYIVMLAIGKGNLLNTCGRLAKDLDACKNGEGVQISRTQTIISIVIGLLIQTYCLIIVHQYAKVLAEKRSDRDVAMATGPKYAAAPISEYHADSAPKAYAYSDPHNAFGSRV